MTTRFQLEHVWDLPRLYLTYRQMRRDLNAAPGLIRYAFFVESPAACCTFSIWTSEEAIVAFSNVPRHLHAVRLAKRLCRAIWSASWRLDAVSKYASEWPGDRAAPWPEFLAHPVYPYRLVEATRR